MKCKNYYNFLSSSRRPACTLMNHYDEPFADTVHCTGAAVIIPGISSCRRPLLMFFLHFLSPKYSIVMSLHHSLKTIYINIILAGCELRLGIRSVTATTPYLLLCIAAHVYLLKCTCLWPSLRWLEWLWPKELLPCRHQIALWNRKLVKESQMTWMVEAHKILNNTDIKAAAVAVCVAHRQDQKICTVLLC